MADHFWIVETPRSIVDRHFHRHVIFRLTEPKEYMAGPFATESEAIDWINKYIEEEYWRIPF